MDALQGVTFALTSTVQPLTVSATLDYRLSVHVVADSKFLTHTVEYTCKDIVAENGAGTISLPPCSVIILSQDN